MLQISEWLPNPKGTDTLSEWVELTNAGDTPISTTGYALQAGKKVISVPPNTLAVGEYLLLPRTETKLSLKNTDEVVLLYDPSGTLIDESKIIGSAPEGKSFSRIETTAEGAGIFIFSEPTPGKENIKPELTSLALHYPVGVPLHKPQALYVWILWAILVGIGLAAAIMTIIVRNEALSNLISKRNNGNRPAAR